MPFKQIGFLIILKRVPNIGIIEKEFGNGHRPKCPKLVTIFRAHGLRQKIFKFILFTQKLTVVMIS